MKKEVILFSILLLILIIPSIIAVDNVTVDNSNDEDSKVAKAYECLDKKITERGCDELSSEEAIFALLSSGNCKSDVIDDAKNDECWPHGGCSIKMTAQAILALDNSGGSTEDAEKWLISQNETPTDLEWFLQIDSTEATTCKIKSEDHEQTITINADKTINSVSGSCFDLSTGKWWLRINPSCYDEEFSISCNKGFLTNLLFKKKTSSTINVLEDTTSASAEGTTTEKVNAFCFEQSGGACDYEGSLWATITLKKLGYDVTPYLPYLVAMANENEKLLPESFLYSLTGYSDFNSEILQKQKTGFWDESGDKFYDTSVALLSIPDSGSSAKSKAIDWLLEVQDSEGCWQGNIRNTAFILYSAWPKTHSVEGDSSSGDCEDSGYNCMSSIDCAGQILGDYDCSGVSVCCNVPLIVDPCLEQWGQVCDSDQECEGGTIVDASDTSYGESCCINGACKVPQVEQSTCELSRGVCQSYDCGDGKEESFDYSCDYSGDRCCVDSSGSKSYLWVWILIILIILVIVAIIFRDSLRMLLMRFRSFGKSNTEVKQRPGFPPSSSSLPQRRLVPRRILPSSQPSEVMRKPVKRSDDLDDVLKKLRDMGK